jgi:hypothetical protein
VGSFEGRLREEVIKENPLWYNGGKFIYDLTPPNGESFESFFGRVDYFRAYLDEILRDHNVIVCSHNQTLKLLYSIVMNIKPNKIWYSKNFENGVLYKIGNLNGIQWKFAKRGVIITGYPGSAKDIVLPTHIEGAPIIGIDKEAFCIKQLTSVIIPDSVTSIGNGAFAMNHLISIGIPESITSIEDDVFTLNNLTSVVIPDSVISIGDHAFSGNKLTSIVIPKSVTSIGDSAFTVNHLTSIVIPDSVASVGDSAFCNNELTSVVIPDSVTSIEDEAFCFNKLTSIVIPKSVTFIGDKAFCGNKLTSVSILSSVASIGEFAFAYNKHMGPIMPDNIEPWMVSLDNEFRDCYEANGKQAGVYTYSNNVWKRE